MEQYMAAFKAYDIRAIYNQDIDEYFCYIMGYALGQDMIKQYGSQASILISSDTRQINKSLIEHFHAGLDQAQIQNIHAITLYANKSYPYGITSTSAAYHIGTDTADITAIFTASHNPAEYTGIKMFDKTGMLTSTTYLKELFVQTYNQHKDTAIIHKSLSIIQPQTIKDKAESYNSQMKQYWEKLQKKYTFVVDFCHGAAVSFEKEFYTTQTNKHTIVMINDYPDGTFPAHEGDTNNPQNYTQIAAIVQEKQADFGVMFDGDADRIGFVSNTGQVIPGDIIYAIIAKQILQNRSDKPILLYDCMSSKIVPETIQHYGGTPMISPVGRFFINQIMKDKAALAGGEVSGHYMFGDRGSVESVLLAQYYVMKEAENYPDFDTMIQEYNKYYKGPIQNKTVKDKQTAMQHIQEAFADQNPQHIDGISVYTDNYWFNVRPSNTEDKIRFTIEANDEQTWTTVAQKLEHILNTTNTL